MTADEIRDRQRALRLAEMMMPSPQCIGLYIRDGSRSFREVPVVAMASRGGDMRSMERKMGIVMRILEQQITTALKEAHEAMLKLALEGEE